MADRVAALKKFSRRASVLATWPVQADALHQAMLPILHACPGNVNIDVRIMMMLEVGCSVAALAMMNAADWTVK
jgi:hypothetical protein